MGILQQLRSYQREVGTAVLDSVLRRKGLTFTVEIARQGGKNELSAQLELLLLTLFMAKGGQIVKAAPTFKPQALISLRRLRDRLDDAGFAGVWSLEGGNAIQMGLARSTFLSAVPSANVVGNTADLLLEADEAQDVDEEAFFKEFRPMGATGNATTVLYGTPWDGKTLLEAVAHENQTLEQRDGIQRHFPFDWEAVAACNPHYRRYVEAERERLGEEHPLFRTQYRLLPLASGSGLLDRGQLAQLQGDHPRERAPRPGCVYVAGVDVAGEPWGQNDGGFSSRALIQPSDSRDSTVVTIGLLEFPREESSAQEPHIRVVEHYRWRGTPHHTLAPRLADLLKNTWRCRRVIVDATGLGAGVASHLVKAMGSAVEPFVFTAASKSRLGFDLLAAINTGRVKAYAADGSEDHKAFWKEMESADVRYRPNQTMDFFVDPGRGHDDYLMSLALLVKAAEYLPRTARGRADPSV